MLLHYKILKPIGSGGMGEVYLAQDTKLKRKAALKLLPSDLTSDKKNLQRFEHEARAASALNHPNILTIYEIGERDGVNFIATEFIDGVTLREKLAGERLSFQEVLDIAVQVASALSAAHEVGVIHRDIKPENIMLRRDGIVKVLDFGLAKTVGPVTTAVDGEVSTQHMLHTHLYVTRTGAWTDG
jgi:serine/threonine protein kinase